MTFLALLFYLKSSNLHPVKKTTIPTAKDSDAWLPITAKEVKQRGWQQLDVILFSGDAYIDHPAFGPAVVGRLIESTGLRVAIVPQPNWRDDLRDFKKLGAPRLFFGVTAGSMDSMVNHYTAHRRRRSDDAYSPGGMAGLRPDYAVTVYTRILKKLYPDIPVIIGGIEASLRRLTHYDYWSDQLKPGILFESGADLLIYGMGEQPLREILHLLEKGVPPASLKTIPQTAVLLAADEPLPKQKKWETLELASHETCLQDKIAFARNFKYIEIESNKMQARRLVQRIGEQQIVVNPPYPVMTEREMDASFDLPYTRLPHPKYRKKGSIPAYEMIRHSITMHRGCFGGCSFCTISAHQGKFVASRSSESIMREVEAVTRMPDFRGTISDLGGPSANMYRMMGKDLSICARCQSASCIFPVKCYNLNTDHQPMIDIYRKVAGHPKVKNAFVASGIRYDLLVGRTPEEEKVNHYNEYIDQLVRHHVSGRLKVAPEHSADNTLKIMRKPSFKLFYKFKEKYDRANRRAGKEQPLVPYFISSHPGCTLEDMAELAAETKSLGFRLQQVQDFTPTPMTVATVIYYAGYHPYTLKPVFTPRSVKDKRDQKRFFFWYKPENKQWIRSVLNRLGRKDLIDKLLWNKNRR